MQTLTYFLKTRDGKEPSTSTLTLIRIVKLVLTLNSFLFNNEYYRQFGAVAMGSGMGPCYAYLFIGYVEHQPPLTTLTTTSISPLSMFISANVLSLTASFSACTPFALLCAIKGDGFVLTNRGYPLSSLENDLQRVATISPNVKLCPSEQSDATVDKVPLVLTPPVKHQNQTTEMKYILK